jgi:ribosomal protein S6
MNSSEAHKYQLDFHLLNEDLSPVSNLLKKHGAETDSVTPLKKVHLAYPLKKQQYAFFGTALISVKTEVLPALNRDLTLAEGLLRFSLVKPGKPQEERKPRAPKTDKPTPKSDALPTRIRPFDDATLSNEALESKLKEISQ